MNVFRFHPYRRPFHHNIAIAPLMTQEAAAPLFTQQKFQDIVNGHAWLVVDLASRCLHRRELPAYLGEELAVAGLEAIWQALGKAKSLPTNLAAFLSTAAEEAMIEFIECDALAYVPPRTRRDRKAKRRAKAVAPTILRASELARSTDRFPTQRMISEAFDERCRNHPKGWSEYLSLFDLKEVEDLYAYCQDQLDRDLIHLRHDEGAGPRPLEECAGVLSQPYSEIKSRLDAIENRLYRALERRKPKRRRSPGTRQNILKKSA